jgi:hypothetical protein
MSIPTHKGAAAAAYVIMSHVLKYKKVIFVEGPSDGRLIDKLLDDNSAAPIAADGVYGVIEALDSIAVHNAESDENVNAIGFIDRDYLALCDASEILLRRDVVTSCYRDIEIDLFHTKCIKCLLEEKGSPGKWTNEAEIVSEILSSLHGFSLLRAYNAVHFKCWNFKDIDLDKYISTSGEVNEAKLFSVFRQKNRVDNEDWSEFERWRRSVQLCKKSVTRGHDVALMFGKMLRKALGNRSKDEANQYVVEENLRLAAEKRFVEAFSWFKTLESWINITS